MITPRIANRTLGALGTAAIAGTLLLSACAAPVPAAPGRSQSASVATVAATPTAAVQTGQLAQGISEESLRNAQYRLPEIGAVQLRDGTFEYSYGPGATQVNKVGVSQTATGELNGDGKPDGAAVLWVNTGGTGTFIYVAAVTEQDGKPQQAAIEMLGDRVQVQKLAVENGKIVVDVNGFAPGDPQCCPSSRVQRTYALQGDKLVVVSEVKPAATTGPTATPGKTGSATPASPASSVVPPALAAIRYDPVSDRCSNEPTQRTPGSWQYTQIGMGKPVAAGAPVSIQLRNKFGNDNETHSAIAVVTDPDGGVTTGQTTVKAADWNTLEYPKDFKGASATRPGAYTIVWQVDGGFAVCHGFQVGK